MQQCRPRSPACEVFGIAVCFRSPEKGLRVYNPIAATIIIYRFWYLIIHQVPPESFVRAPRRTKAKCLISQHMKGLASLPINPWTIRAFS